MKKVFDFIRRHQRVGIVIILIVFTWAIIGSLIIYLTPLSGLKRYKGVVTSFETFSYNCGGVGKMSIGRCEQTRIKISNSSKLFKVRTKVNDGGLIGGIGISDTVTIYTEHWYQYIFSFGPFNRICQLEKDGEVYYEFNWIKENKRAGLKIYPIFWVVLMLFLIIEIYTERNVMRKKKIA
jgi:hypothetical protein